MKLTPVQDQAIAARMALVVGATTFDRLFAGVKAAERAIDKALAPKKKRLHRPE